MVGELRIKAQIRETFGKYVDTPIVAALIARPERSEARRPAALVTVLNRYMTVMSEPVRRQSGIIDKYIGDAIMAFWGPPFTGADEQAGLASLAALAQLANLAAFSAE